MRPFVLATLAAVLALGFARPAAAQAVGIDRGVRAAGLWCFPLAGNPKEYLYLPAAGRLGTDASGGPEFSFVRYVENSKGAGDGVAAITEAGGGGVLQFLALYETPASQVAAAEKALRDIKEDPDIRLRAPLVFNAGRYAVVSSVARVDAPEADPKGPPRKMIASGNAPVLEGSKIAVSFGLDKRDASILNQSFQMANPDVSVVFEMQFSGLTEAYDAELEVDWEEIQKDRYLQAGLKTPWIGLDVQHTMGRLLRNNAIRVKTAGDNAPSEAMMNMVYTKLVDLMFRKVDETPPQPAPETSTDALSTLLGLAAPKLLGFSVTGAYRVKDLQTGGRTVLRLNHQATVTRTALITFNIGDLHRRYGEKPAYFRTVNLDDPAYKQREVRVAVDGSLAADFEQYINSVTLTLRKVHEDGETTLKEIVVNKDTFLRSPQGFTAVYGWRGDNDRTAWLSYEHRASWSFRDGGTYDEDWQKSDNPAITLLPPYERREVTISGDLDTLKKAGVRHAIVTLGYDFFGKPRSMRPVVLRVQAMPLEEKLLLIQPRGDYRYRYDILWHFLDGREAAKPTKVDTSGLILIDDVPSK